MIKNFVFAGGGVRGIGEAGAWQEFERAGLSKNIERVAGTSAGAIMACIVAMRYTSQEIVDIINKTDFKSFEDGNVFDDFKILKYYGIHPGEAFLTWIQDIIKRKTGNPNSTFRDFQIAGFLDLNVFAASMKTKGLTRFNAELTPNTPVSFAVRASMSIPLFFRAFRIDDEIFVDGGTCYNYPITAFDKGGPNEETLGVGFANISGVKENENIQFGSFAKYIKALAETSLGSQTVDLINNPANLKRTISIDTYGISAINFSLSETQKMTLFNSGKAAMLHWLNNR